MNERQRCTPSKAVWPFLVSERMGIFGHRVES